ncbi:hypothetical protein BCG9842_A0077 (plasmid) [Bacillus cereus G9842]|uniref:Uncharacterized protein n=1 Tax=Bacillus cereus (strain G9842) TaxID=405531 RepID=B7IZF2_BACC2|nr:hypothetical protein BCG9842_A0077 [Bacillus cereus G9842]
MKKMYFKEFFIIFKILQGITKCGIFISRGVRNFSYKLDIIIN